MTARRAPRRDGRASGADTGPGGRLCAGDDRGPAPRRGFAPTGATMASHPARLIA